LGVGVGVGCWATTTVDERKAKPRSKVKKLDGDLILSIELLGFVVSRIGASFQKV